MFSRSIACCLAAIVLMTGVRAEEPAALEQAANKTAPAEPSSSEEKASAEAIRQAAKVKLVRAQGYKPITRNGEVIYCKREAHVGSHLEGQTCGSLDEIAETAQAGKETVERIQRQGFRFPQGQ